MGEDVLDVLVSLAFAALTGLMLLAPVVILLIELINDTKDHWKNR